MTWVRTRLLPGLEGRNVTVCIDTREFALGAPLVTDMEQAVVSSRATVSVLTRAYLKSDIEKLMAQHPSVDRGAVDSRGPGTGGDEPPGRFPTCPGQDQRCGLRDQR
jgi:hypothetical protein